MNFDRMKAANEADITTKTAEAIEMVDTYLKDADGHKVMGLVFAICYVDGRELDDEEFEGTLYETTARFAISGAGEAVHALLKEVIQRAIAEARL